MWQVYSTPVSQALFSFFKLKREKSPLRFHYCGYFIMNTVGLNLHFGAIFNTPVGTDRTRFSAPLSFHNPTITFSFPNII